MKNFLNIKNDDIILSTTLMIFIDVIYSQLSESVMLDENFLMINVIIKRLLLYFIRKFISFMFYVSDI